MSVARLSRGARVLVHRCGHNDEVELGGASGIVERPRICDDGAWVALDARHAAENAHPFRTDDLRATHVLAYPENCDELPVKP